MPKRFQAPDPDEKRVQYGDEVVRNINKAAADSADAVAASFEAFATSPEPDPSDAENGAGEPDPQGDSAANQKEN